MTQTYTHEQAIEKIQKEFFFDWKRKYIVARTLETSFGWLFIFKVDSNSPNLAAGLGPIIFNKSTGYFYNEVPGKYPSMDYFIEDYEKELEAGDNTWILRYQEGGRKKLILAFHKIFNASLAEAKEYIPQDSTILYYGKWRDLDGLRKVFLKKGVELELTILEKDSLEGAREFAPRIGSSLAWLIR